MHSFGFLIERQNFKLPSDLSSIRVSWLYSSNITTIPFRLRCPVTNMIWLRMASRCKTATMSSKLVLAMLMTQTWLWTTTAEGLGNAHGIEMFNCENNTVLVSFGDCSRQIQENETKWNFEVEGRVMAEPHNDCGVKIDRVTVIHNNVQVSSITCPSTPTTDVTTPTTQASEQNSNSETTGSLGAMVGLLLALLALTNIVLAWTCYIMKKRGKIIKQLNTRLNGINQISNPQYGEDMSTSWHQNASLIPTYETIPDRQIAVSTTELKEHGYDVLHEAMPKTIHRDTKDQRRSSEKESSIESSSRYTLKLTQVEESDQAHVETGKSGYDARYSRGQTVTEEGIKRDRTNTDQEKIATKVSKEEGHTSHSDGKSTTEGRQNGETESTTSEHNYFCLEESVKVNSDDHQQENCDMEREGHRRDSTPPKGATARDYEDFVPSK